MLLLLLLLVVVVVVQTSGPEALTSVAVLVQAAERRPGNLDPCLDVVLLQVPPVNLAGRKRRAPHAARPASVHHVNELADLRRHELEAHGAQRLGRLCAVDGASRGVEPQLAVELAQRGAIGAGDDAARRGGGGAANGRRRARRVVGPARLLLLLLLGCEALHRSGHRQRARPRQQLLRDELQHAALEVGAGREPLDALDDGEVDLLAGGAVRAIAAEPGVLECLLGGGALGGVPGRGELRGMGGWVDGAP